MSEDVGADELDDREAVCLAREGDPDAYGILYRRHAGRIFALCLRMTADRDEAQDCTQATFVQGWEKLAAFEGRSAFGTWLHRIAVNEVLARRRKAGRRRKHLDVVGEPDDEITEDPRREQPGLARDLEEAVASLPDGARDVLVLHEIHGYSHEETAQLLGVAVGTCKAQLHRARKLLRARLER